MIHSLTHWMRVLRDLVGHFGGAVILCVVDILRMGREFF
jgi:hypothetical protein